jgi:nicotinamidase-related amidase
MKSIIDIFKPWKAAKHQVAVRIPDESAVEEQAAMAIREDRAALLIIDVQDLFIQKQHNRDYFVAGIEALAAVARQNMPVIHIFARTNGVMDLGKLHRRGDIADLESRICSASYEVPAADYVLIKNHMSGFNTTELAQSLHAMGVDTILLAGVNGELCVRHTAKDAGGFNVIFLSDHIRCAFECAAPLTHTERFNTLTEKLCQWGSVLRDLVKIPMPVPGTSRKMPTATLKLAKA